MLRQIVLIKTLPWLLFMTAIVLEIYAGWLFYEIR